MTACAKQRAPGRRLAGIAVVAVAAVLAARSAGGAHGTSRHATPGTRNALPPTSAPAVTVTPDTQRRAGPLVLQPGRVVDLDSLAPDWQLERAPGSAVADLEFTDTYRSLTGGHGDSNLGILPPGSVGTRKECSLLQDTGITVQPARIRPGLMICALTNGHHRALLRVTDVQQDTGRPDIITFQIIVWAKLHYDH
ncbi:hypothetical protein [Actinoallomurus rhizosphaericola]|uniref:hypothetical protein n=1 Tax=Actinoallomurus rhizosphaericola TaxID=2952536 RepID=UPI0020932EA5|nr:hypothetical protein [Actinoallomurus rhizosphaericola]MCO5998452.1 hypothetical protein [Actinoallomurus rhizosphaericola]